jgi:aminoglycoside 3-N-acetyltransferase
MSRELELIQKTPFPATRLSLAADMRALDLEGAAVMVHTSLSSLGWVNGGAVALIQALMDAVGQDGTIVMPAHSGDLSDPAIWCNPPVPQEWLETIRATMPAFEPEITPTRAIGRAPELFRKFPGVLRSSHPSVSFCAWGRQAAFITDGHSLDNSLGEHSPLARLYELDGLVLQLGTDYGHNTSLHLAEYRSGIRMNEKHGAPIFENGQRIWKESDDIELDSDAFNQIGLEFEASHEIQRRQIALADCRLMHQRQLVDFACAWFRSRHEG